MAVGQGGASIDLALKGLSTTDRQVGHWIRQGWLKPTGVTGTGYTTELSREELAVLRRMAQLVQVGFKPEPAAAIARQSIGQGSVTAGNQHSRVTIIFEEA